MNNPMNNPMSNPIEELPIELLDLCHRNGVPRANGEICFSTVMRHIRYVREAGEKLNVPAEQLEIHDASKFSSDEFPFYAKYFKIGTSPVDAGHNDPELNRAWLHHENSNPHHLGYWIPRTGDSAGSPLEMPTHYVLEMVADWHGASMEYTGHWDISVWLNGKINEYRALMHSETFEKVLAALHFAKYDTAHDHDGWFHFKPNTEWESFWGDSLATRSQPRYA